MSRRSGVHNADLLLGDGDWIAVGSHRLEARATPGHTSGCMTFVTDGMAFTGDALLIRGCGRTDFQEGDPRTLFRRCRDRILSLPATTALFPAHDYRGRTQTSVAEELRFNPRLGADRTVESFIELMDRLTLAYPKNMDEAIPANLYAGLGPDAPPNPQGPGHGRGGDARTRSTGRPSPRTIAPPRTRITFTPRIEPLSPWPKR